MGNHVPMEHHVVSLETNTFVSVLREKKEQTVWKKVRTTFKFVADKKPLPSHLIHFAIFPGLHTLIYSSFTKIFVLHAVVHIYLLIPRMKIIVLET